MKQVRTLRPGLLYFAYGCNMDPDFLSGLLSLELQPGWPARLDGWRLAFNKGGEGESGNLVVANVVEEVGCSTYGVVYRLPREALSVLDDFEETPEHYRRATVWVEPVGRQARQVAEIYLGQPSWLVAEGPPDPAYLELLVRGARRHDLPRGYIAWLQRSAAGDVAGCYRRAERSG
ncbi:MAG: gamma-glutamylcyclotransferase [Gemmatimonadota bacterium]|nr:MAG: gamma-glutamylcyclotransferase [Gemmatimonadota bacterium]